MKFKKIILDSRAKKYIKKEFKRDENIGLKVFKKISIKQGEIYTYLPENMEKNIYKFTWGGKIPVDESLTVIQDGHKMTPIPHDERIYFAREIKDNLAKNGDAICVLRSGWWEKKDNLHNLNTPTHYLGKYPYYILPSNSTLKQIEYSIGETEDVTFNVGFITKKRSDMKFLERYGSDISAEEMAYFIDNISMLFASGYDFEGHIIWKL